MDVIKIKLFLLVVLLSGCFSKNTSNISYKNFKKNNQEIKELYKNLSTYYFLKYKEKYLIEQKREIIRFALLQSIVAAAKNSAKFNNLLIDLEEEELIKDIIREKTYSEKYLSKFIKTNSKVNQYDLIIKFKTDIDPAFFNFFVYVNNIKIKDSIPSENILLISFNKEFLISYRHNDIFELYRLNNESLL